VVSVGFDLNNVLHVCSITGKYRQFDCAPAGGMIGKDSDCALPKNMTAVPKT
jgi:hypothetical protein